MVNPALPLLIGLPFVFGVSELFHRGVGRQSIRLGR